MLTHTNELKLEIVLFPMRMDGWLWYVSFTHYSLICNFHVIFLYETGKMNIDILSFHVHPFIAVISSTLVRFAMITLRA